MSPRRARADAAAPSNPVVEWRRRRLLEAGFAADLATELASDCATDLHFVLDLIDRGCPPDLCARILAPMEHERRPC